MRGMRPIKSMKGEAAERLRRLRLWLSVLFTAMNTVGLVVFAPLIVYLDEQGRQASAEAELRRVTSAVARLIRVDGNAIDVALVPNDPMYRACPRFAIVSGDASFPTFRSQGECADFDDTTLEQLAAQAVSERGSLVAEARGTRDEPLYVMVEPYAESGSQYTGAVVAWADFGDQITAHRRVQTLVLAGSLVLLVGVAVAGYWLAGRAIGPAAAALKRQEELLADTAHDLRTPVAALRAHAETAVRDPAQRNKLLPDVVKQAARMGDIIEGLLKRHRLAAGVEELSMQPLWLDQLVDVVVGEVFSSQSNADAPDGSPNVTLITAPSKVLADRTLVERAVRNLLDNAVQHGHEPGQQPIVTVTVAGGTVTVADRGPGVDPQLSDEELFARFTSTRGSSGLGLSIVRWVAEAHGGSLSVHNAEEGGAIFEFRLPPLRE